MPLTNKRAVAAVLVGLGLTAAACGSSSKTTSTPTTTPTTAASSPTTAASSPTTAGAATTTPSTAAPGGTVSAKSFTSDFSAMAQLTSVAKAGNGKVGVILPDTVTSTRYTEFDAPLLAKAFSKAGLASSDVIIQNAQGSDATQLGDAQTDITNGATVLVVDPLDSSVGAKIEALGKQRGVPVIDYDRLTLGGSRKYYISFNNVQVGKLIGNGLVSCAAAWHVAKPNVIVMVGSPTDNNATLFAQGYNGVIDPYFSSGKWTKAASPAGTWDPPTALSEFEQARTAHPSANAVLMPNDENGAPIIQYLKNHGVGARSFPVTGQDATLTGLQNILSGYQCGTAYKPIYLEAQAAAAVALYARAGQTPPASLVNGTTQDTTSHTAVKSVLLTPNWVTTANMASTVVKDKFVPASQICTSAYAAACKAAGISG